MIRIIRNCLKSTNKTKTRIKDRNPMAILTRGRHDNRTLVVVVVVCRSDRQRHVVVAILCCPKTVVVVVVCHLKRQRQVDVAFLRGRNLLSFCCRDNDNDNRLYSFTNNLHGSTYRFNFVQT